MAQLGIKGHNYRYKEVIEILEMLGGNTSQKELQGTATFATYYINSNGCIIFNMSYYFNDDEMIQYTLEEFLEKYPYKVGDWVQHKGAISCGSIFKVEKMQWDYKNNRVKYIVKYLGCDDYTITTTAEVLQPYEEETMDKNPEQIMLDIPNGYEFFGINDDNKVVLTKKQFIEKSSI